MRLLSAGKPKGKSLSDVASPYGYLMASAQLRFHRVESFCVCRSANGRYLTDHHR